MKENFSTLPADTTSILRILAKSFKSISEHSIKSSKTSGLNPSEFAVMEVLYLDGPQKIQQIGANLLLVSSGNVTYILDKLEKNQLVVREHSKVDRRAIFAKLTKLGVEFMDNHYPQYELIFKEVFSILTFEEQEQLKNTLQKVRTHSEQLLRR
ncbi:MarR family winged helix-turn-helix transcriptional regulator [Cytobacillus firmus]|uniref:MarR family winged helix-turn-helix transcriptional regulator n=1 Tax=Cytobacillus firmus TaxID=1399 RepID=UPI0018CDACAE|nr:MarR family transcriptional regulator [Cytobacillus firmus]MBG9587272.1 hypothetical protein [Cytobacillus firmus]